jgi:hypothetical protein
MGADWGVMFIYTHWDFRSHNKYSGVVRYVITNAPYWRGKAKVVH